jgi:hypothetical protein
MTQDEIIEMAKQAGAVAGRPTPDAPEIVFTQCLDIYHFAKLVAQHEREKNTKICQELAKDMTPVAEFAAKLCAKFIEEQA